MNFALPGSTPGTARLSIRRGRHAAHQLIPCPTDFSDPAGWLSPGLRPRLMNAALPGSIRGAARFQFARTIAVHISPVFIG